MTETLDLPLEALAQNLSATLITLRVLEQRQAALLHDKDPSASTDPAREDRLRIVHNQLRITESALQAASSACSAAQSAMVIDAQLTPIDDFAVTRRQSTIMVPIHSEKCRQHVSAKGEHRGLTCTCAPLFEDVLEANAKASLGYKLASTNMARIGLAVVTCIDSRIDFQTIFGLRPGDAKFLRNAGARATPDVIRGLAAATAVLGVTRIALIAHTGCKMAACTQAQVVEAVCEAGADPAAAAAIDFLTITDQVETVRQDVQLLRQCKALRPGTIVGGFVLDMASGVLKVIDDGVGPTDLGLAA